MTTFAWVIDQTSCIGCHACTTACKQENEVPLGVNRTWVKYDETGTFPQTRRQIAVLRCNHCAEPPCVEVCPTSAMFRRPDGIVDFDTSRCIGCKACLQACPYDAIYIARNAISPRSATSAPTASIAACFCRAWSSVRPSRSSLATSTTRPAG